MECSVIIVTFIMYITPPLLPWLDYQLHKQSTETLISTPGVFLKVFTHFSSEFWSSSSGAASSGTSPHHRNAGRGRGEASCVKEVATPSWSSTVAWQRRAGPAAGDIVVKTKTERDRCKLMSQSAKIILTSVNFAMLHFIKDISHIY